MRPADIYGALEELNYTTTEGSFGRDLPVSIPAQLRFTDPAEQDTERFHAAAEARGLAPVDTDPERSAGTVPNGPYYAGELCWRAHYSRVKVLVFRGGVVRVFPKDEYVPRAGELARLLDAIEVGFASSLAHDPIETEAPPI